MTKIKGYGKTWRIRYRLFKRKNLWPFWHNIRWPLVGLLLVVALVLGYIGFEKHAALIG